MWNFIQKQSASVIIDTFLKTKLLNLSPPDHNNNSQTCLAANQTPLGTKSEEIEEIAKAYMETAALE